MAPDRLTEGQLGPCKSKELNLLDIVAFACHECVTNRAQWCIQGTGNLHVRSQSEVNREGARFIGSCGGFATSASNFALDGVDVDDSRAARPDESRCEAHVLLREGRQWGSGS